MARCQYIILIESVTR